MEKKVIRSGVFVKIIGIITTAIFSLVSLFLAITGNIMASICFLPFVALGILLLLAYNGPEAPPKKLPVPFYAIGKGVL